MRQSPFALRIKSRLNKTFLGKLNVRTHVYWEHFRNSSRVLNQWFYNDARYNRRIKIRYLKNVSKIVNI